MGKAVFKFIAELLIVLGAVACIFQWLGIKPKDLAMSQSITIPHALWLLLAIVLFAVGIGSSAWSGIVQRREINRLKSRLHDRLPATPSRLAVLFAEYKAINGEGEVRNVTDSVKAQTDGNLLAFKITNGPLGMDDGDDLNFGERKRLTVKYSLDGGPEVTMRRWERDRLVLALDPQLQGLNDFQVKAIQIAVGLLAMLDEIGPKPLPKYTELEIRTMAEPQRIALLQSKDKDYTEACDYYFGGPNVVVSEREPGHEDRAGTRATARYNFHRPWEAKVKAKFEARFSEDLSHLRKGLSGADLFAQFPKIELEEWNPDGQLRNLAKELWSIGFDMGKMKPDEES
jgi:hypothetical protein